jgi:hypothetical protein
LGTVELLRMGYSRPGAPSLFPLDRALALPARSFSYELQWRLVKAAVQNPFLESVQTIAEWTGVSVSKRSLERSYRMRLGTSTLSTSSAMWLLPLARSWWPPLTVRAFPWSSLAAHNPKHG